MKKFKVIVVFMFAFSLDIRVKASESEYVEVNYNQNEMQVRMEPKKCLENIEELCYLRSENGEPGQMYFSGAQVEFPSGAIIARKSEEKVRLVSGYCVVQAKGNFTVETRYGLVKLKSKDVVLVELKFDRVEVTAISGMAILEMLGGKEKLKLPMPYQNWMGAMLSSGDPRGGRPRPGSFSRWIELWGKVSKDKDTIRLAAEAFREPWKQALFSTGQRDVAAAEAHQNQLDELRRQAALKKKRIREENQRLRQLFIEKTFEEDIKSF